MNKQELIDYYRSQGYKVADVEEWRQAGDVIENTVKYDVPIRTPDLKRTTAQVEVENEGTPDEEAVPLGVLEEKGPPFQEDVRTFLASLEGDTIFSTRLMAVSPNDEGAEAIAYIKVTEKQVERRTYVLKRRDGTFSFKEITNP